MPATLSPLSGSLTPLGVSRRRAAAGVESTYCLGFDGSNDYADSAALARNPSAGDFSAGGWFLPNSVASLQALLSQLDGSGTGQNWLEITASGKLQSQIGGSATTGATTLTAGIWHHLAVTVSGTTLTLYVNGLPDGTATRTAQSATGVHRIGASKTPGNYFGGRVDDVRIYSNDWTAAEIQTMYRNSSAPPTASLVGYWSCEDGTGTTVSDGLGGSNTLTLTNGPTWQPQTPPRLIASRNTEDWSLPLVAASSQYVVTGSSVLNPSSGDFTATGWVKFTSVASQQVILSQLDGTGTGQTWLELTSGAKLQSAIGGSNLTGATSLIANAWYHVAIRQTGTTTKLYLNGYEDASGTRTPQSATGVMRVGISKSATNPMGGSIKDFRIYNDDIATISYLANGKESSETPIWKLRLNEGTGSTANDSIGSNHGTLTNGPTWTGDVPQHFRQAIESSYALSCDGTNDYVSFDSFAAALSALSVGSVSAWNYATTLDGDSVIFSLTEGVGAQNQLHIEQNNSSGDVRVLIRPNAGSLLDMGTGNGVLTANVWHHLLYTSSTSGNAFYWNGAARTMGYTQGSSATQAFFANITNAAYCRIGNAYWLGANQRPWGGMIDEVCIYNRALTAAEAADAAAGYLVTAGIVSRYKLDGSAVDSVGSNNGTEQGGAGYSTTVPGTL